MALQLFALERPRGADLRSMGISWPGFPRKDHQGRLPGANINGACVGQITSGDEPRRVQFALKLLF